MAFPSNAFTIKSNSEPFEPRKLHRTFGRTSEDIPSLVQSERNKRPPNKRPPCVRPQPNTTN
eukprot:2100036-Amphidinium_carterae.1